jgi:hypothetical protein
MTTRASSSVDPYAVDADATLVMTRSGVFATPAIARTPRPRFVAVARPAAPTQVTTEARPIGRGVVASTILFAVLLASIALYGSVHLFFRFNRTWLLPTIVTPSDPRVLTFTSKYLEEVARREALLLQRADVASRKLEAEKKLALEQGFLASTDPSDDEAIEIARDQSIVAGLRASDELALTTRTLETFDQTIRAQERILAALRGSPYYGITSSPAVVAFVPYDNRASATEGARIYACRFVVTGCRDVGSLVSVADAEVVQRHPWLQHDLRGVIARISIDDRGAAENAVLYIGRPPLF